MSSHLEIRFFGWELRLWAVDGLMSQKVQQNPKSLMIRARVHWLFMYQKFQGLLDTHLCRGRSFEFVMNSYQVSLAALSNSSETSCKLLLVSYGWLRGWYTAGLTAVQIDENICIHIYIYICIILSICCIFIYTRKATWSPKMQVWKMLFPFKGMIFRFHANFQKCIGVQHFNFPGCSWSTRFKWWKGFSTRHDSWGQRSARIEGSAVFVWSFGLLEGRRLCWGEGWGLRARMMPVGITPPFIASMKFGHLEGECCPT